MQSKIALFGNRSQSRYLDKLDKFVSFLIESGFRVFIQERFATYLNDEGIDTGEAVPVNELPPGVDLVVSLGGDGTFLRAAAWVGEREIPIIGINTGHLGYLSACSIEEAPKMIADICKGNIRIEKRMVLQVDKTVRHPEDSPLYALNEITLSRDDSCSIVKVKTKIDGFELAEYAGDGLIISTPTGSTAYNLSAGGPIIEPTVDCIAVTPIAPHTLTLRPLVVSSSSEFYLIGESRSGRLRLSLDDRSSVIKSGEEIKIKRAPFDILVVRQKNSDFARILREKLFWNGGM